MSEWNGEGIPPVGTVCEATWGEAGQWLKCVILSEMHLACLYKGEWSIGGTKFVKLRPLQPEEKRQVAEIEAMVASYSGPSNKALAQEIYNAGFRKVEQ